MKRLLLLSALAAVATAPRAQEEGAPLTPEEIATIRRQVAAQEAAEVASPEDVETLRERELDAEAARSAPGYANDTSYIVQTRRVDVISDGRAEPHRPIGLDLAQGIITSVAFYDFQGQPWPVQSVAYDKAQVAVNNDGCQGEAAPMENMGNVFVIAPCAFWTTANMQVLLAGETRPIPFVISSGTRE